MRKRGIYAFFGYDLPVEESLRAVSAAGFDAVSLWSGEYDGGLSLARQAALAASLGLCADSVHAPFDGCNALWLPGRAGDEIGARLCADVSRCAAAGIPVLVFHLTDGESPPPVSAIGLSRLEQVIEAAAREGVRLAAENLRWAPHLGAVLHTFDTPTLGFCYDSGHAHGWGMGEPLIERFGHRLLTVHLHDNDRSADIHGLPYDGTIDWTVLADRLAAVSYGGPVMLEVMAGHYESTNSPDAFLRRALQAAERFSRELDKAYAQKD